MTVKTYAESGNRRYARSMISIAILMLVLFYGIFLSGEAAEYVKEGITLAIGSVIPTSFPFMIISDFYVAYGSPESIALLKNTFAYLFALPDTALAPFICGNIGGFPIGAKMVADRYVAGTISKEDAERLLPICNNPSCAFIIGGVGLGIYKDTTVGIILFVSVMLASILCGIVTRNKREKCEIFEYNVGQSYSFIESVKNAAISSISVISFICVFCVILGIIKKRVRHTPVLYVIYAFAEVTNAVKIFSRSEIISPLFSIAFSAFSLGFGGICVAMQSASFTSFCGLSMRKYIALKLLEGVVSSMFATLLFYISARI